MVAHSITPTGHDINGNLVVTKSDLETTLALYADEFEFQQTIVPGAATFSGNTSINRIFSDSSYDIIDLKSFSISGKTAKGNNLDDDLLPINAVINESNSRYLNSNGRFPTCIVIPPGVYLISGPLTPILGSTQIISPGGPGSAVFNFVPGSAGSSYDGITFKGISSPSPKSCSSSGINGLKIGSYGITGGNQIVFDWCTNVSVKNVVSVGAYNFCSLRQVNLINFVDVYAEGISGQYGIKAYGAETSRTGNFRNNAQDWVSLLGLYRTVLIGNNNPGITVGTPDLILLDGAVQTVNFNTLILLQGKRGWHTTNTPNVPNPLYSSFLWGQNLQIETHYAEPIRFECANSIDIAGVYAVGSQTASGIYLGANVNEASFRGGRIQQNYAHGVLLDGAQQVGLAELSVYGNSQAGSGLADGIHIQSNSDRIRIIGGLSGRRVNNPITPGNINQYIEMQAFGIHNNGSGNNVSADIVDLLGNVNASTIGSMYVSPSCFIS